MPGLSDLFTLVKVEGEKQPYVQIDRVQITSAEQAQRLVEGARSGQVVSIFVERAGEGRNHIANVRRP